MSHRHVSRTLSPRLPLLLLLASLLAGGVLAGCDSASTDESGTVFLEGRVVSSSGNPVSGALVHARPGNETALTDSSGFYSLTMNVDSTMDVILTVEKEGYQRQSETVIARAGETSNKLIELRPASGEAPEDDPGRPSNILLLSQTRRTIGVKESGAPEVARVTFQVADSTGRPIDLDESTQVHFRLGQAPAGAFVSPESAPTNNNGEVTVNVSSGTTAGVVQLVATADAGEGATIRSLPVSVTIHGGLPDQAHFTVGPAQFNFPGLLASGLENTVNVIVGDQYGNPVVPGTAVYFTTTSGVIEGAAQTDAQGRGSVTLTSGKPLPQNGIAVVTASTADDQQNAVTDRVPVVFSGSPALKVTAIPGKTFAEPLDLSVEADVDQLVAALGDDFEFGNYEFIVEDGNGNPLPPGSTVGFDAGGTEVGSAGDANVTLGDTEFIDQNSDGDALDYDDVVRGRGVTFFSASAVTANDPDTADQPDLETITFRYSGTESQRSYTFSEPKAGSNQSAAVVMYEEGTPVARFSREGGAWE